MRQMSLLSIALVAFALLAGPASAGPLRNLVARIRGNCGPCVSSSAAAPRVCPCNPVCDCDNCGCGDHFAGQRAPLVRYSESLQIRGVGIGYSLQSRPPFVQIQKCQSGQCAVPGSILP